MDKDKNLYDENSIESLDPLSFTRLRPEVYCGSTEDSTQLLVEAISNSIDEYRLGHGNKIIVSILPGGVIEVKDFGQGFLVNSIRPDGKTVLEASFSVFNTSGKYREDGTYEGTSTGLYGIGSKLINFLSHWTIVRTNRDGKSETVFFKEGVFERRELYDTDEPNGTKIEWLPSEEFFTDIGVNIKKIKDLLESQACLCPGLVIHLAVKQEDGKEETFIFESKKGISDLLDKVVKDNEILNKRFSFAYKDGKYEIDAAMTYTSGYSSNLMSYVNMGLTESGPHITQIKTLITRTFNKFLKNENILKTGDSNLSGEDIQEGMCLIVSITAPNVAYDAQTKTRVSQIDMKPLLEPLGEALSSWMEINDKEVKAIAEKALNARKAREAAKKAKEKVRQPKEKKQKLLSLPTKLVDAWSKDRSKCELLITEGDSAANGLIDQRNSEYQAISPIRGKIINLYKASKEKVFANQEVIGLIKALGLELNPQTSQLIYDKNKLRYGKIILCADAEVSAV